MSNFVEKLKNRINPSDLDMTNYLLDFHNLYPGITEEIMGKRATPDQKSSYEILINALREPQGKTVVDLACGSGKLTELCVQKVGPEGRVIAVDLSEQELALAKKRIKEKNVTFRLEPAQKLSLANSSVDVVLCHIAFNLMRPIEPVVQEIRRVLKLNGMFHAVIGGIDNQASLYNEFCDCLDKIIKQDLPQFLRTGLGDSRTTKLDGLRALFKEGFYFENHINFVIEFRQELKSLVPEIVRYFYPFYFLSKPAQEALQLQTKNLFQKHETSDGMVTFEIPHVRISVRKTD